MCVSFEPSVLRNIFVVFFHNIPFKYANNSIFLEYLYLFSIINYNSLFIFAHNLNINSLALIVCTFSVIQSLFSCINLPTHNIFKY